MRGRERMAMMPGRRVAYMRLRAAMMPCTRSVAARWAALSVSSWPRHSSNASESTASKLSEVVR